MEAVVTPRDVLRAVRKHWLAAGSVFILTLLVVAAVTFTATPIYRSSAVLLVKVGREFGRTPDLVDQSAVASARDRDAIINAHVQILRSKDLMTSVVASVGQDALYPDLAGASVDRAAATPNAVARFGRSFAVEPMVEAFVIRISFRHPNPDMTVKVVNSVIDLFKEKQIQAFDNPEATAFLDEKVATYRKRLEEAEAKIQQFQAENRPFLERGDNLLRERADIVAALGAVENEIAGLRESLAYLTREWEKNLKQPSSTTRSDPVVSKAKANLLELQLEEQRLLAAFKDDSRQVANVRKQIELVKIFLAEQEAALSGGALGDELHSKIIDTRSQLLSQEARRARLRNQLSSINEALASLPRLEAEHRDLVRERDAHETNYQTYSKGLEEARVSEDMDRYKIANISVIEKAVVPETPISPKTRLNLVVGAFLGAALGIGLAFLVETKKPAAPPRVAEGFSSPQRTDLATRADRATSLKAATAEPHPSSSRSVPRA